MFDIGVWVRCYDMTMMFITQCGFFAITCSSKRRKLNFIIYKTWLYTLNFVSFFGVNLYLEKYGEISREICQYLQSNITFYVTFFKDIQKAFHNFKRVTKMYEVMFFICKILYIVKVYSIHYTLRKKTNFKKITFEQNERYKKYPLFSFVSSNSLQFYLWFAILIWAEVQGLSL